MPNELQLRPLDKKPAMAIADTHSLKSSVTDQEVDVFGPDADGDPDRLYSIPEAAFASGSRRRERHSSPGSMRRIAV
jgi:hypothetical protein